MCLRVNDGPLVRDALEDRQALRRDRLIAAGVQLLGDERGPAVTVRAVCRKAGLTERYFYESFADRDEFVRAVYDDVCTRAMSTLMSATTPGRPSSGSSR
ncbi:bacterial regulatory s, tetR family protein [Mycobacterium xenopi 4042]|uniref:Bacterial regulatory s, tetR family protein n=1 Tax=Mycobacterium xenopi 4042 TaxID=1299334 RepID=X7ZVL1_MYCXE|nr:bacterial regulatory s, tetR family protein [Mycobacterium xenopi 4042]